MGCDPAHMIQSRAANPNDPNYWAIMQEQIKKQVMSDLLPRVLNTVMNDPARMSRRAMEPLDSLEHATIEQRLRKRLMTNPHAQDLMGQLHKIMTDPAAPPLLDNGHQKLPHSPMARNLVDRVHHRSDEVAPLPLMETSLLRRRMTGCRK